MQARKGEQPIFYWGQTVVTEELSWSHPSLCQALGAQYVWNKQAMRAQIGANMFTGSGVTSPIWLYVRRALGFDLDSWEKSAGNWASCLLPTACTESPCIHWEGYKLFSDRWSFIWLLLKQSYGSDNCWVPSRNAVTFRIGSGTKIASQRDKWGVLSVRAVHGTLFAWEVYLHFPEHGEFMLGWWLKCNGDSLFSACCEFRGIVFNPQWRKNWAFAGFLWQVMLVSAPAWPWHIQVSVVAELAIFRGHFLVWQVCSVSAPAGRWAGHPQQWGVRMCGKSGVQRLEWNKPFVLYCFRCDV